MRLLAQKGRNTWRALTSMGTALVLLFLLALGAIPGALLITVGALLVTGVWNDFVGWLRDAFVSDVRLPI